MMSFTAEAKLGGVAEPWAELGTSLSDLNSCMNDCAMGSKTLVGTSVRAGMEPFLGLKSSWPCSEASTCSQASAFSRCGAPLGSPKLSTTVT